MDWNWYDYIEVQYEDDYSSWSGLNTLWGPLDSYEAQTNNGWTQGIFEFYTGYTSDLQAVRLVFFSNYWDESTGILIDDFAIMELQ